MILCHSQTGTSTGTYSRAQKWSRDDLVLDSFAGSGTTGAVAHKMGRRWIMVELGEHCHTHIIPRLKKVIDGEDPGGVTEAVGWKGGGGFRYYQLAPSLLEKDKWGNWVISKEYNAAMLAEALCKLEGFTYAPSDSVYWQHGHSHRDGLHLRHHADLSARAAPASQRGGRRRSARCWCCARPSAARRDRLPNLTVKKIPKAVLLTLRVGPRRLQPEGGEPAQARRRSGGQQALFDARRGRRMNRHVNAIAGRLSLRPPQRQLSGDPRPHHRDRAAEEGCGPRRRARGDPSRVSHASPTSSASSRRSASRWPPASARRG